jgi:hypothetical protein
MIASVVRFVCRTEFNVFSNQAAEVGRGETEVTFLQDGKTDDQLDTCRSSSDDLLQEYHHDHANYGADGYLLFLCICEGIGQ